jgi:pimeloyl-ACP methyl ester carboxylesterase
MNHRVAEAGRTARAEHELVVIVHGFGAPQFVMWPLAGSLKASGFRVCFWDYPSLFASIETHAERFSEYLSTKLSSEPRFHIVAHSMGAIVTRAALNRSQLPNLGRIVLLAPPNCGSPVARVASSVLGRLVTPTRELSSSPTSYVNQLVTDSNFEIGVIAAKFDLLVPEANTHLASQRQHKTIIATHNSLLFSRKVSAMTSRFLRTGALVSRLQPAAQS